MNNIGHQVVDPTPAEGIEYLQVTDTNCSIEHSTRSHDIIYDGRRAQVTFEYGKVLNLPIDVALKFLKDASFIVVDPKTGKTYDPTPKGIEEVSGGGIVLAPNQVVASLDELTQEALFLRAKQTNGSDHIKKGTPKTEIIAFLAAAALADRDASVKASDDIDRIPPGSTVGGALTGNALAALVPDPDGDD